jgi:hypothetical protein
MRRLSLILSDLYVPEEVTPEKVNASELELPHFTWLLRFARNPVAVSDWRAWLARQSGQESLASLPVAHVAARDILNQALSMSAWLATPVRLEARLDHVRLADRGLLRVDDEESARWCAAFAREFGPELLLHPAGRRGFLLTGISAFGVSTVDPARLLDSDVAQSLPTGADAAGLRRLGAELEMWLHAAPLNDARTRAGRPRITAFWFWGGDSLPRGGLVEAPQTLKANCVFYGGDPYLSGLSRAAKASRMIEPPERFSGLDPVPEHHIVELAPMSGPRESLESIEANWFAPARAALLDGTLGALDIVANDRWFRIGAHPGWRWWRKRRNWFASLGRNASAAKA